MSEAPEAPVAEKIIKAAFASAKTVRKREKKEGAPGEALKAETGHYGGDRGRSGTVVIPPVRLPPNSPVTAIGHLLLKVFVLDRAGQFHALPAKELGRLVLIKLFGSIDFLTAHWPAYDRKGIPKDEFDHGRIAPVIIASCHDRGIFNPFERVRGPGAWVEDDGALVMHCGDVLHVSGLGRTGTGLRRGMLYPASPPLPEPEMAAAGGVEGPGAAILARLETWAWARPGIDEKLALGWLGAALLGGATEWRPMLWVTGGAGTGKSTFQKLVRWILGPNALIRSEDATRAYVFQRIGYSSLPVQLDEFESQGDNRKRQEIIDLARAAASGGLVGRGGADGVPSEFTARTCFLFSAILIPPLRHADRSRMAILELRKLPRRRAKAEDDEGDEEDGVLGSQAALERIGRQLRGRLLAQWPRYIATFRGYHRAMLKGGHSDRAADQFGSIGAAYDLIFHDGFDEAAAAAWAAMLPAASLAETSGYLSEAEACKMHLAAAQPQLFREGARETIGKWLRDARYEREKKGGTAAERTDANRVLAKLGLMIYRDAHDANAWWIAVSNTHEEISKIFANTQWGGQPGAPGTWSQALKRLANDDGSVASVATRRRIDGQLHHCVSVPWDLFFPPVSYENDGEEERVVDSRDRE